MNTQRPNDTDAPKDEETVLRSVRTFADDLKRARARSASVSEEQKIPQVETEEKESKNPPPAVKEEVSEPPKVTTPPITTISAEGIQAEKKESLLGDEDKIFDSNQTLADQGTIITDRKRKRWTLRGALGEALGEWTEDTRESLKELVPKEREVPKVAPSSERASVIKQAGEGSQRAPQDDHKIVLERLRTLERDVKKKTGKPFSVKEKPKEESAAWAHVVPEPTSTKAPAKTIKKQSHTLVVPPPEVAHTKTEIEAEERITEPEARIKESETEAPTTHTEEAVLVDVPKDTPHTPAPAPAKVTTGSKYRQNNSLIQNVALTPRTDVLRPSPPEEPSLPDAPPPQVAPPVVEKPAPKNEQPQIHQSLQKPKQSQSVVEQLNQHRGITEPGRQSILWPIVIVGAIIISVALLTGTIIYFLNKNATDITPANVVPTLVATNTQVELPFSTDRLDLLTRMRAEVNQAEGVTTQFYFTAPTEAGTQQVVATEPLLRTLAWRTPGSFTRTIKDITFGASALDGREPAAFMIMRTGNFDSALAGMIAWETFILDDLSPFMTNVNRESQRVTDAVVANRDTRIMVDGNNQELLLYTFINPQTILITTDREVLRVLVERF